MSTVQMNSADTIALIHMAAAEKGIDPILFQAICTVENARFDPLATRYEKHWKYFYFPAECASRLGISRDTEEAFQAMSWGFCQVMGAVAREYGYQENLLKLALEPLTCLRYGAQHLKKFLMMNKTEADAIASWNAGSVRRTPGKMYVNQGYVDKVDQQLRKLRALV